MTASPSDEWLLALLDEKSPEEFTPAELAALRERAHASPEVRAAIAERVRLEAVLHAKYGEPGVTAESVIRRAATGRRTRLAGLGFFLLLLAAAGATAWWFANRPRPERDRPRVVARSDDRKQVEPARPRPTEKPKVAPVEATRPKPLPAVAAAEPQPAPTPQADAPPAGPWAAALANDARVVPFEEAAFAPFGETVPGFEVADEFPASALNTWVAAVPNRTFNVNEGQWRGKRFAGLEGTARLLAPWRPDAVLRLATFDVGEFSLHFWTGGEGYLVRFYPHIRPQLLAAYAVTREGADPTPKTSRLVATDGGTHARANAGAIEIRHQEGRLVVTRGAVPLLVLPMPEPPGEVLLDGRTRLRTLAMYRGEPAPLAPAIARRNVLISPPPPGEGQGGGERPSTPTSADLLTWVTSTEPPARLAKENGRVTLSIDGPAPQGPRRAAWAAVKLPAATATGLCEAVFRLDGLTPGTGLYLGDADGKPIHALFASENTPAGRPTLAYGWTSRDGNVPEPRWRWDADPKQELVPAAGGGTWVKILVGPGGLKTFFSGDGEHWGPAARNPERAVRGSFASTGLFAMADGQPRTITVSGLRVRELSGIATAADPNLRSRVPAFDDAPPSRPADWLTWVMATRPGGVSLEDWLRACGVESLARGVPDAVANAILDGLARDAIDSDRPAAEVVALLHDAALLSDLWGEQARGFAEHYERLARRIVHRGGEPSAVATDLAAVGDAYLASPIWTESRPWALPPSLLRNAAAVAAWSPGAAAATSCRFAALLTPGHPESGWSGDEEAGLARLAAWGAESSPSGTGTSDGTARFAWRHPLGTEPGREAATVAAELEAALAAGAYEDAAQLTATLSQLTGLVPAAGDPNRFVPAAGFVAESAARHPDLVKTLTERFGPAGLIRVREAAASGDEVSLLEAAVRFFGTPAAAEANRRLGDTALADGQFDEAASHFAAALATAPENEKGDLLARRRLAASLAGEDAGEPIGGPVAFGPQPLDPAAFERLVAELRQARGTTTQVTAPAVPIPAAVAIKAEARGRLEGDVGRNPGRGEFRRFDWAGRQISATVEDGIAYLTNRFQVVAFDLGKKSPAWAVGLGGEQGETHALPNVPFTPLVEGDRLYVRRLSGRAPELACLATKDGGKLLWRSEAGLAFASDAVRDRDSLLAVTYRMEGRSGGPFTLSLTRVRPTDGRAVSSVPLVTLNDTGGDEKPYATLTGAGDGFVISTWGTAACCDADGALRWIRKLPHLPESADPDADRLSPDPPLVAAGRVVLASPGSRAVIVLDLATGRLLWTRPLGELQRLRGTSGSVPVAHVGNSLLALDAESGATKWSFHRSGLLEGLLLDETTVLATARTELEDKQDALSLIRLDAVTGRPVSEQVVRVRREDELRAGPMFVHESAVWGLLGESWRDPKRTLVEFAADPSAPSPGPAADPAGFGDWLAYVEPATEAQVAAVLPGWTPIGRQSGNPKKGAELRDEYRGERTVLVTESNRDRSAQFVRRFEIPTGASRLVARVGREGENWTLRLLADGKPFASEPVDDKTAPDGWRTATFDLSPLAGKTVTLLLDQAPPADKSDQQTKAFWKSAVIE